MKVGFIGTGNMAHAIIKGLVNQKTLVSTDILVTNIHPEKAEKLAKRYSLTAFPDARTLAHKADIIILSVKPHIIPVILEEIKDIITTHQKVIVSIAAGKTIAALNEELGHPLDIQIIRAMPNMNATINEGATGLCANAATSEETLLAVEQIFQSTGKTFRIDETLFPAYTALAGCSPAFVYLFIDSLARAGVKHGLPKELATSIAAQAVLGSAKNVLASPDSPQDLIDQVCSPGGTTITGLLALEENLFQTAIKEAVDATIARDQELT